MEKFNYVYVTTNSISGKQYIGDHSTININDSYLGSGKALKESIKIYGKENFKREILEFFATKKEAFEAQEKYIIKFNTMAPNGYNISPTGGLGVHNCLSKESRDKIGLANKGKQPWLGKRHSAATKIKISNNTNISGEKNPFYGKKHSEETKIKISNKLINRKLAPFTDEHKRKISLANTGHRHSDETKIKIGLASKNRTRKNKGLDTNKNIS